MLIKLPHTDLWPGSLPTAVLTCGDPERAAYMAGFLQNAAPIAKRREYHTFSGTYQGVPIAVCSHGIGAPGAAIAFEELVVAGARRIVRLGTCGSLQPHVQPGHLVIATAAVQQTGYGQEVAPHGYPAVPDITLTYHLLEAARREGHPYHKGLILTRDAFFAGVATPRTPVYAEQAAANVLAVEMECAALFLVGSLRQVQTASVLAVNGYVLAEPENMTTFAGYTAATAAAITTGTEIALRALVELADKEQTHVSG
jgi:uridine phosphorylase